MDDSKNINSIFGDADTITLTSSWANDELKVIDLSTIDLSSTSIGAIGAVGSSSTISMSPSYTVGTGASVNWTSPNANVWTTTTGTGTSFNWGANGTSAADINQSGKISLRGEGADVDINGKSLKTWMEKVEERLNILTPNPELEKEWDDLRRLGERYRKLEKKCKEKAEVWKKLKAMPPPKLD